MTTEYQQFWPCFVILQGAQLQRELKEDDNEIKVLEEKLQIEQKKYEESFTRRQKEVDSMEVLNLSPSVNAMPNLLKLF